LQGGLGDHPGFVLILKKRRRLRPEQLLAWQLEGLLQEEIRDEPARTDRVRGRTVAELSFAKI
jgi:hypothetical protein